jgi:hypothetical protein
MMLMATITNQKATASVDPAPEDLDDPVLTEAKNKSTVSSCTVSETTPVITPPRARPRVVLRLLFAVSSGLGGGMTNTGGGMNGAPPGPYGEPGAYGGRWDPPECEEAVGSEYGPGW